MLAKRNNGGVLLQVGLVLVVLAALALVAFYRLQGTARVKTVTRDKAVDAVTGTVLVDADGGTRELKSQSGGVIAWCEALAQGAHFKENDRLLELDSTELKRDMDEAERRYKQDKERTQFSLTGGKPELLASAALLTDAERDKLIRDINPNRKLAKEKLDTAKRLLELGNIAEEDVRNLERALENIDLELKVKALDEKKIDADYRAGMDRMNDQLKRMTILAPSDGQVDTTSAWKGMLIGNGQTVANWFSNQRVVAAKISEESFGKVRLGQPAKLRLLTYGWEEFDAKVSKMLPKADDAQRFTVFLDVKADPEKLKPNSTGEVTITVDEHPNALMIPRIAVFDGDKVFVVNNGRVEKRKVRIGYVALNRLEILEGLKDNEQVIIDNLDEFRDGQRVRVAGVN